MLGFETVSYAGSRGLGFICYMAVHEEHRHRGIGTEGSTAPEQLAKE